MGTLFHKSFSWSQKVITLLIVAIALALLGTVATTHLAIAAQNNSIVSSLNPSTFGQNVTFTATFNSCQQNPLSFKSTSNGGTIAFYDGNNLLANVPDVVIGECTVTASFSTATLSIGTHHISAAYGNSQIAMDQVVNGPRDVPEGDTLLLLGGGMSGVGVWLRYQWNKRRNKK